MNTANKDLQVQKMEPTRNTLMRTPATDIYESEKAITVVADMPGVSDKGLEVTLENSVLTLVGRSEDAAPADRELLHREFGPAEYRRTFSLAEDIDRDHIAVKMKAGQVRITLPKAAKAHPRKIAVEVAS